MDEVGGNIVLIVNGKLIRDDAQIIATILQKLRGLMDDAQHLVDAITALQTSIANEIQAAEDLLTQPHPDIPGAVAALQGMRAAVDAETQRLHDAVNPPAPPTP